MSDSPTSGRVLLSPATDQASRSPMEKSELAARFSPNQIWRLYSLAGLAIFSVVALWYNFPRLAPSAFNWAETGNTAAALAEGRGFSDPFTGGTGPTAWVPPLMVWLEAGIFFLTGVKTTAAAKLLLVCSVAGLSAAHALLIAIIPTEARWMRRISSSVFIIFSIVMPTSSLEVLSESWLVILLSLALLWSALEYRRAPRTTVTVSLVLTAVLAPLANAGLTLATATVLVVLFCLDVRSQRSFRALLIAGFAATVAVGGWTVRNAISLGGFIPLKSNLWFEVYLANVASPEGWPRAEAVMRYMPFFNVNEFDRYATLGETRYVASFRAPALAALRAAPAHFAANVMRRAATALVYCSMEDGGTWTRIAFSRADMIRLTNARHLLPIGDTDIAIWTRVDLPPNEAQADFVSLGLDDLPGVWRAWLEKRHEYYLQHTSWRGLATGFVLAGLPSLALLGAALAGRGKLPVTVAWAALIAAAMLLPFVLVNHGLRHQLPLLGLHAVMIGACVQAWWDRSQRSGLGQNKRATVGGVWPTKAVH